MNTSEQNAGSKPVIDWQSIAVTENEVTLLACGLPVVHMHAALFTMLSLEMTTLVLRDFVQNGGLVLKEPLQGCKILHFLDKRTKEGLGLLEG